MHDDFYRDIIEKSPIGCVCHKIIFNEDNIPCDYEIMLANPAFASLMGVVSADLIGKKLDEVVKPKPGKYFNWLGFYGDIAISDGNKEVEYFSEVLQLWFRVRTYVKDSSYMMTSFIDISKEKKQLNILEGFFKVNLHLLCIADQQGNFIKVNKSWEEMLGYSIEELQNRKFLDFIHPDDLEKTIEIMGKGESEKEISKFVNRYLAKDGSYRFIEWHAHHNGDLYYAAAQDITDRMQEDQELQNINKKLENYSYTVAHDLKEPIRSIRTFSEFIQEDYELLFDETAKDYFDRIIKASNKMALMINDLLLLSQIGRNDVKFGMTNINDIMINVLNILEHTIKSSNTEIEILSLPEINCQPTWITTVFQNLITNSIKYNDKDVKKIEISYQELNNYYEFSIKDNGQGIPEDQYDKIFGLFRKAHRNKNVEGSGAGLAIVKSVIDEHRGNIWVNWSKLGEGTVIKFTINKILKNKI